MPNRKWDCVFRRCVPKFYIAYGEGACSREEACLREEELGLGKVYCERVMDVLSTRYGINVSVF